MDTQRPSTAFPGFDGRCNIPNTAAHSSNSPMTSQLITTSDSQFFKLSSTTRPCVISKTRIRWVGKTKIIRTDVKFGRELWSYRRKIANKEVDKAPSNYSKFTFLRHWIHTYTTPLWIQIFYRRFQASISLNFKIIFLINYASYTGRSVSRDIQLQTSKTK